MVLRAVETSVRGFAGIAGSLRVRHLIRPSTAQVRRFTGRSRAGPPQKVPVRCPCSPVCFVRSGRERGSTCGPNRDIGNTHQPRAFLQKSVPLKCPPPRRPETASTEPFLVEEEDVCTPFVSQGNAECARRERQRRDGGPDDRRQRGSVRRRRAPDLRFAELSSDALDMPFYQTGRVRKDPILEADVEVVLDLLDEVQPINIFVAGDLSAPTAHTACATRPSTRRSSGTAPPPRGTTAR